MKKKYIGIIIAAIVVVGIGVGFFVYKNNSQNKGIQKANELIKEREYNKALASFELVLDDNSKNQDAVKGKEMLEDYMNANKKFNDGDLEEANKVLKNIPNEYSNYKELKEDVDSLKDKINKQIKENEEINKDIDNIRDLIKKDKYTEAKKIVDSLKKKTLDENQKKTLEDLKGRVDSELEKSNEKANSSNENSNNNSNSSENSNTSKNDMEAARTKYLNEINNVENNNADNKIDGMDTTSDMNKKIEASYSAWNNVLNDICEYLEANLSNDESKELAKNQITWKEQVEQNAREEAKPMGASGGPYVYYSNLSEATKDRCYELVNEYMN